MRQTRLFPAKVRAYVPAFAEPTWFANMGDKTWATPVSNTLDSVKPVFGGDHPSVCTAWTGGCINEADREFILLANGGHGDYGGNEGYGCRLGVGSPAWERLSTPATASGGDTTGRTVVDTHNTQQNYGDGSMTAVHGWNRCCYANGRVWYPGIDGGFSAGNYSTAIWSWLRSTQVYTYHGLGITTIGGGNMIFQAGVGLYDRTNNLIWSCAREGANGSGQGLFSCNASTGGSITAYGTGGSPVDFGSGDGGWGANCYDLGINIYGDVLNNRLAVLQTSSPSSGYTYRTPTGTFPIQGYGCVYHQPSRALLLWHNNGASLIKIAIPADPLTGSYAVTTVSASGSNAITPSAAATNGTFSRFNIIENMGNGQSALTLVNSTTGSTYVYKLPAAGV